MRLNRCKIFLIVFNLFFIAISASGQKNFSLIKGKFFISGYVDLKGRLPKGVYHGSEFSLLDKNKKQVGIYSALQDCVIKTSQSTVIIELRDQFVALDSDKKKVITFETDTYSYNKNGNVNKQVKYHPENFRNATEKTLAATKKFKYNFIDSEAYKKMSLQQLTETIQRLFIASINNSQSAKKYLSNFAIYYKSEIDGELKETLNQYQNLLKCFNTPK